jgi:dolichol-phosphate mannosyltransferase
LDLSIVVPVHNEAENIEPLITEIRASLAQSVSYELIYVDDASTDDTLERLRKMQRHCPQLRILQHSLNCGQSTALLTGIRSATAPIIATLDGDGQNDPKDIPRLLRIFQDPERPIALHMVVGHRRARRDNLKKRISSRVANTVRRRILKDDTPDTGCSLKVFYRDTFLSLPYFDHMHRFLPALFRRSGKQVQSVEVNHRPRPRGTTHYNILNRLGTGIVDMLGVMWLQRRSKKPEVTEWKMDDNNE